MPGSHEVTGCERRLPAAGTFVPSETRSDCPRTLGFLFPVENVGWWPREAVWCGWAQRRTRHCPGFGSWSPGPPTVIRRHTQLNAFEGHSPRKAGFTAGLTRQR